MPNTKRDNKDRIDQVIKIIGVILFILGLILFIYVASLEDFPYNNYFFEIEVQPSNDNALQEFQVYYDFDNGNGKISFYVSGASSIQYIILNIPNKLNVTNITWYDKYSNGDQVYSEYIEQEDYDYEINNNSINLSTIILKRLKENFVDRTFVEIYLDGAIYPNAKFEFLSTGSKIISVPKGNERSSFFKFKLSSFGCENQPYFESKYKELQFLFFDNMGHIAIKPESYNGDNGLDYLTYLTFDLRCDSKEGRKIKPLQNLDLVLSISDWKTISFFLMSFGVIHILEIFILVYITKLKRYS